jgi:hypothetical protein
MMIAMGMLMPVTAPATARRFIAWLNSGHGKRRDGPPEPESHLPDRIRDSHPAGRPLQTAPHVPTAHADPGKRQGRAQPGQDRLFLPATQLARTLMHAELSRCDKGRGRAHWNRPQRLHCFFGGSGESGAAHALFQMGIQPPKLGVGDRPYPRLNHQALSPSV